MVVKFALLFVALLAGCNAIPTPEVEEDMSIFFDHTDPEGRIVGGSVAPVGSHPHMIAMTNGAPVRGFVCGGSMIAARTVLTAAHCIRAVVVGNALSGSLRVTAGTNRWNSGGQVYALLRGIVHYHYNANIIKNDIGILHTNTNMTIHNLARPIVVNYDWVGMSVPSRVAGWGRIRAGGALSVDLLQLNLATIDGNRCVRDVATVAAQLNMGAPPVHPAVEICTFHSRNHGTCNGDSGSALVRTDRWQQIGIVSWGLPCALGAPDIFVRVSAFRAWVQGHTLH